MPETNTVEWVKFATQLTPDVLTEFRTLAHSEGRQLRVMLDEALREYIANRKQTQPKRHVLDALRQSMAEHDTLYRELSK